MKKALDPISEVMDVLVQNGVKTQEKISKLEIIVEQSTVILKPSETATALGIRIRKTLKGLGKIKTIPASDTGDPVFTAAEAAKAKTYTDEKDFDVFMTPFLSELLNLNDKVLVNSEQYEWLDQGGILTKPDFFLISKYLYEKRDAPKDNRERDDVYRFGVVSSKKLRMVVFSE